ncbi:TonB-dependent receptor [Alteromonas pelagimontana]|uniref:TonB-dependent receptor n=1 Tax=Alteromonas pelagimontana TaxID=1858656 RepID=A0A6M4MDZ9_9ALTE|nr:porin family protein [Alteromonas pelagimontana]QJR80830.1 TonB-dependent receptor [Alteromonas pelagimontana]
MRKFSLMATLITGALSFSALADSPDWQYVEGGYTALDIDNAGGFDPDGATIGGKYMLKNNIYLSGDYSFFEDHSIDIDMLSLGAGYRMRINAMTDAYVGANYERIDSDFDDENGYSVNAGIRSRVTDQVELAGEIGYYDVDEGDVTVKVGANYYFTPQWAIGASYEKLDDADITQVTARYAF